MKASSIIWALGTFFGLTETAHYGWNWEATTDAEMICDGIVFAIFALAVLCGAIEKQRNTVTIHNNR